MKAFFCEKCGKEIKFDGFNKYRCKNIRCLKTYEKLMIEIVPDKKLIIGNAKKY